MRGAGAAVIGIDVGGTFTDCILMHADGVEITKVPSQPGHPDRAVADGIQRLLQRSGVEGAWVSHLGHGTTVATNTVIEETGARVGVLVTRGFRDVLFLGRVRFPNPTDIDGMLPRYLLSRQDVREVEKRVTATGEIETPLALDAAVEAARDLVATRGVTAIAICLLHAHRNREHEQLLRRELTRTLPDIFVTCSSEVSPRPREYERFLTTVLNAYVGRRMRAYLTAFSGEAKARGIASPVLVTKSNGGIMNVETAGQFPVQTMLSGPAAGVVGALHLAKAAGYDKIITWDMGGTSLDIAIVDGRLRTTEEASIGEYPLFIPTVDVMSMGAGGGSLGWIDAVGILHVGPRSAGADPGPACYGRGGTQPTLTDAYVALGIVDPARFANGEIGLDRDRAIRALETLGHAMGLSALATAEAMLEVATAQMHAKFMPMLARFGIEPAEYVLFPFGGAGPTHCFLFAMAAGIDRIVVPPLPGLLCAWGSVIADLRFELPQSLDLTLDRLDEEALNRDLAVLGERALAWLRGQGVPILSQEIVLLAQMRYVGQSFELEIPLDPIRVTRENTRAAYLRGYQARYGYADPDGRIELVSVLAQAIGRTPKPESPPLRQRIGAVATASRRRVHLEGQWMELPAYRREALLQGDQFRGPVLIDQSDTTTYVPAGFEITVDRFGNLVGARG